MTMRSALLVITCATGCAHGGHSHNHDGLGAHILGAIVDIAIDAAFTAGTQPATAESGAPSQGEPMPDTLDRDLVLLGLADAQPELARCAQNAPITVTLTVRPGGDVEHFEVAGPPAVQQCVANAMLGVSFTRTRRGASFHYVIPPLPPPPQPEGSA
jgi:hypothetical protein